MHHEPVAPDALGKAGALAAVDGYVVAACEFRRHSECFEGVDDDGQIFREIPFQVTRAAGDGIVEVLKVVINRSAACDAPGKHDALLPQIGEIYLGRRVLVEPYYDRRAVLPQEEHRFVHQQALKAGLVEGHVEMRIGGGG